MFKASRAYTLLLLASTLATSVQAISRITRSGRYLYDESGSRFYIKGVAYQEQGVVVQSDDNAFGEPSTFVDPLAIGDACKRDLPYLQELGVNTIRVYSVNSSLNHDDCMTAFSNAGIYTIIDLALPLNGSIDRLAPTWSTNLLNQYTQTIDALAKYDNVLAYNVGNEVVLQESTSIAPFVKAAARDIRAYLTSKGSSALVGYAAINGASSWREPLANYLSCDISGKNSGSSAIDIYGLNDYEWCGSSTFQNSYARTTAAFANYNVVAYFSEFGCIKSPPRLWTETEALFGSDMNTVWSGGIAFSYFPAASVEGQFGIVTISQDGKTVTTSEDFTRLKEEYGKVSFINSPSQSSAASSYPTCAAPSTDFAASNTLPSTPNAPACECVKNSFGCQFTPVTSNYSTIVGELLNYGCSLLGQGGLSCDAISGNGGSGVYGDLSGCDPTIKLAYVMTQYYLSNAKSAASCSFAGNGTVNPNGASSASAASSAQSSCIANPSAVFTPAPAGNTNKPTGTGGSSAPAQSSGTSAAISLVAEKNPLFALGVMVVVSTLGAVFTWA